MTEAGEKWALEVRSKIGKWPVYVNEQAEFWLRAFCDEVEQKAKALALANSHGVPHDPNFVDYSEAFDELKRELLGD